MIRKSITIIFVLILFTINSYFWLRLNFKDDEGLFWLFIIFFIVLIYSSILPLEIKNLTKKIKIIKIRKINLYNLFLFGLMSFFLLCIAECLKGGNSMIEEHFIAIQLFLLIFLYRSYYIVLSSKYIKYQGAGGKVHLMKIYWNEIMNSEIKDNELFIYSDGKVMIIDLDKLTTDDKNELIKTVHNKSYKQ